MTTWILKWYLLKPRRRRWTGPTNCCLEDNGGVGVRRFPPPQTVFDKGARRADNNLFWSSTQLVNYIMGSTILNTGQVFSRSGILAATLLYMITGRCARALFREFMVSVHVFCGACSCLTVDVISFLKERKVLRDCEQIELWCIKFATSVRETCP